MASPTFRQGASAASFSSGPVAVSFPSNTVAGNLLLAFVSSTVVNDVFTVSDGVNVWSSVAYTGGIAGNAGATQLWYAIAVGGASTVSVSTPGGTVSRAILIGEWSGKGFVLDKASLTSLSFAAHTSLTSSSVTTTTATEIIIGFFGLTGNVSAFSAGSGFILEKQLNNNNGSLMFEDKAVSSAGPYTSSCTLPSTSGGAWQGIATFTYSQSGGQSGLQLSMDASLRNSGVRH